MFDECTICKEGSVPVYQQLIEYFKEFIKNNPPGTKLLPERELAKSLDVSRNSLRQALEYFYKEGLIVRHRRKGTFTVPKRKSKMEKNFAFETVHPMAYYNTMMFQEPPSKDTLTLAFFENMPFQKEYWEKVVEKFNNVHSETKAVIEWLPANVSIREKHGFDNYFKSINKEPDLIQCSLDKTLYDLFTPLSKEIVSFLKDDECFHESLETGGEYLLERIAPIYTAVPICLWNADMAKKYEITDVREKLAHGAIIELACSVAEKLPPNVKVSGPMPNLMRFWGHPEKLEEINLNTMEQFFVPLCEEIAKTNGDAERIFPLFFRNYPILEKFLEGFHFMDFVLSNISFMQMKDRISFNYETAMFPVQQSVLFEASSLAVSKSSRNKKAAYSFIKFMLSHEIQSFTVKTFFAKPFVKSAMPELYMQLGSKIKDIEKYLERINISCKIDPCIFKYQIDYISYSLKSLFEQIAARKIGGKPAAKTAFDILSNLILKN